MLSKCYLVEKWLGGFLFHVLLLTLFLPGQKCSIPEASQEGTLHSFKSYADVATFYYAVPSEVLRATWQFAAFMDDKNCPPRTVHIYLQWGSYPVISGNNATFPSSMYLEHDRAIKITTTTSFEPKTTTIVPIYSPEPGDWFVGAHLSHWDQKVQQQGLGHKCHYSIGSVAVWKQADSIENIPVGSQKRLTTTGTTSYYKIFVPRGTWNLRVKLWKCNFTIQATRRTHEHCIKGLALHGRVVPTFNHTHPPTIGNMTTVDSYTFVESSPYEDVYYYLMVVSDSVVEFNVEVNVMECPIKSSERPLMREYSSISTISNTLSQLNAADLKRNNRHHYQQFSSSNSTFGHDVIGSYRNQFHSSNEDFAYDEKCLPRYQLTRVKHSQTFSTVYLLQGREWLTSWIMLTDLYPIVTQFNILPLIDIGGTLDISAHLELNKFQTKQLVSVHVCVRRGRVPDRINGRIICDNNGMAMNLSSNDKYDASILIPYPQPDTWHIGLHAECHLRGRSVNCEMEEILVSLEVHTRQCVFAGNHPCSHHGACQEIHRGILYYTACSCFEGYAGWGCTDTTTSNPESFRVMSMLMLTLSNGFFLPAIYLAVKRKLYTEGLVYAVTMLSSSLYHACDQRIVTYCLAKYEVLQYADFFSSILAFWVTLIAIAQLPKHIVSLCHMFGVFLISFGVEADKTSLASILIPLALGTMIPMGSYLHRCYKSKKVMKPARVSKLLVGLLLAGCGLLLFSLVETEANYRYVHSAWHMIIAASLLFLLPPARTEILNTPDDRSSIEDELLYPQDPPGNPIFIVASGGERLVSTS